MNATNPGRPSASRLKEIASLSRPKSRRGLRQTLVEGPRLVESAIKASAQFTEILLDNTGSLAQKTRDIAASRGIPLFVIGRPAVERISAVQTSQGVIGVVDIHQDDPSSLFESEAILVLDEVQDPGNVGTLIRSAAWFGIDAVVIGPGTADPWSPKVVRSAMGGTWATKIFPSTDLGQTVGGLKASGHEIVVLATDGDAIEEWLPPRKVALVVGSETRGVGPAVASLADRRLRIGERTSAIVESLNASVAGTIALFYCKSGSTPIEPGGMH